MNTIIAVAVLTLLVSNANVDAQELVDGAILRAPDFQVDGGWGEDGGWDETEEEELVDEEEAVEEELVDEEESAEGEPDQEIVNFITELLSTYEAQDIEEFESLVSEDYREIRTSDEDEETLDYNALIDAVRYEVDLASAFRIKHRILGVRSGRDGVRVHIQWQMRFENAQTGGSMGRKGRTELVVADLEGWQLITQRQDPLFGAITSESLEGREKPGRRKRPSRRGG